LFVVFLAVAHFLRTMKGLILFVILISWTVICYSLENSNFQKPTAGLSRISLIQFEENDERYFIEKDTGRQIFFHGVNTIVKGFPYVPQTSEFDIDVSLVDKDHALLADLGVNVYRLGTMWPGKTFFCL
jgi:hypothetical protein